MVLEIVYDPVVNEKREYLWEELGSIRGLRSGPWCGGGDFNMIHYPTECRIGGRMSASMRRFFEVIEDL